MNCLCFPSSQHQRLENYSKGNVNILKFRVELLVKIKDIVRNQRYSVIES